MTLVAIKCPNCNGTVQLEKGMTSGFCVHCGKKITNVDKTGKKDDSGIESYLVQAKDSLADHDWELSASLVKDILKLDDKCKDAWYMKALLSYRDDSFKGMIENAEKPGMKDYGVFSKPDIKRSWGEYTISVVYEIPKNTLLTLKAQVSLDGKEPVVVDIGKSTTFGANEGIHEISVCFITRKGPSESDTVSFIVSKDHEFMIKTVTEGAIMIYVKPKMVQLK
ncbi:MAG: hypothetical protein FWC44_02645 [Methanomassiliicoccaceae archaeon]|nr:hypothetical protein [Methanomassiliicoccaceae archaeon]